MAKQPQNIAASVRQKLLNIAQQSKSDFNAILVKYALECLIYRLSLSSFRDKFILKGGMLIAAWDINDSRTTRDIDFLGFGAMDADKLKEIFAEIMSIKVQDGLSFDIQNLTAKTIREDQIYNGIRLKTIAHLANAKIPVTIDVGLGDALENPKYSIDYPSLLGEPIANIRAYPPEAVIAEKYQAIVALGLVNGRLKDYYDLWIIPQNFEIEEERLKASIVATFERRNTKIPIERPAGLTHEFATDPQKIRQWRVYTQSINLKDIPLTQIVEDIWGYVKVIIV